MSLTVIVGAGAAGLAAGLELEARGLPFLILEARDRIGGRAHTIEQNGLALDLGCEWLHHAETNSRRKRFEALGMTIDRRPAAWDRIADQTTFSKAEQADYHRAFAALEARIEEAAEARDDRAVGELMPPDCRWNPLLNAFSAAYNGAAFPQISVKDYAAYDDGRENWRVGGGYGAAIAAASRRLPVRLNAPVTRIEHGGRTLRVLGPFGAVAATSVIVTVPTPLLANGALMFDPPLLGKQEAAAHLPLGHVTKVFIRLSGAAASGDESMLYTEPLGPEPATLFLRTGDAPWPNSMSAATWRSNWRGWGRPPRPTSPSNASFKPLARTYDDRSNRSRVRTGAEIPGRSAPTAMRRSAATPPVRRWPSRSVIACFSPARRPTAPVLNRPRRPRHRRRRRAQGRG